MGLTSLIEPLRKYADEVISEMPDIPVERKTILDQIAEDISNQDGNPTDEFIALMCCSQADIQCPVIDGAISRYPIHYVDPKECDGTDEETVAYDSRCREIAREMFYLMSRVSKR